MSGPTVEYRCRQLVVWLNEHHPTPYPVTVRWVRKIEAHRSESAAVRKGGDYGETWWDSKKRRIMIDLSRRRCRMFNDMLETLIHEWAHAVTMENDRLWRLRKHRREHPDEFWLALGRIYRGLIDDGGCEESRRIDV